MELRYLENKDFVIWDELAGRSEQGSIFCLSWWLEAIGNGARILGCFDKGRLVAGMPLYFTKKFGVPLCTMPKLTVRWGLILEPMQAKRSKALSRQMEIIDVFAKELSRVKTFFQCFSPELQNWLPFYWAGFRQTTRFTYVLQDIREGNQVWGGLRENIRTDIRKAEKQGVSVTTCSPEIALALFQKTRERQNRKAAYSSEYFLRLFRAAETHNAGACFAAYDQHGRPHAAAFLVWDPRKAYYLCGGGDPILRNSGATSLLLWEMIQFASERSRAFDFEGSVVPPIERFFRAFGGSQTPYHVISRFSYPMRIALTLIGKL